MSAVDLRTLVEEQAALKRVAVTVATESAAERVFDVVTEEVARLVGADAANLVCFGPAPHEGVIVGKWSEPGVKIPGAGTVVRIEEGALLAEVARTGAPARMATDDPGVPAELHRAAARARRHVARRRPDRRRRARSGARSPSRSRATCGLRRTPRSGSGSSPASSPSRSRTRRPVRSSRRWPRSRPPSAASPSPLRPRSARSGSSASSRRRSAGCSAPTPARPCATSTTRTRR